jgi:hypothetical protein
MENHHPEILTVAEATAPSMLIAYCFLLIAEV